MSAPWFKMYSADYLLDRDISMLSMEARGILVTIWCVLHRDKHIPDDADLVAAIIHADHKAVRRNWVQVRKHLEPGIFGLYSKRMEKERMEYDEKCARLAENAKAGGKAKAKQLADKRQTKANQLSAEVEEKEKRTTLPRLIWRICSKSSIAGSSWVKRYPKDASGCWVSRRSMIVSQKSFPKKAFSLRIRQGLKDMCAMMWGSSLLLMAILLFVL